MKIIRQSSLGNIQVFSFLLFSATIFCTLISHFFFNIDYCAKERIYESKEVSTQFFHHFHLITSFLCVILIALQLTFWNPLKLNSHRIGSRFRFNDRSVFLIVFTLLWYGATYCLCYLLKRILDDKTCNRTHNSVSGHFLFHSFYFIAIPYWFLTIGRLHNKQMKEAENQSSSKRSNNQKSPKLKTSKERIPTLEPRHELKLIKRLLTENITTVLMIIFYGVYTYCSYVNLDKTWVDGFHSLRQILYGLILSFLSLYLLLFITSKCNNLDKKSSCFKLVLSLGGFWIISILLLSYFNTRIPFKLYERVLFFLCYLFLIYFSIYRSKNLMESEKIKKD
ncbi:hypothetical protein RB653_007231 [Dictyostelium firmibasis]|uniref:Uncharacterized protein n=1 Tax=Dictyostelium firmibasis TaxID=79012 RepID=A0AAN7U3D9_9MYCE